MLMNTNKAQQGEPNEQQDHKEAPIEGGTNSTNRT
jgi:hypothetical protein